MKILLIEDDIEISEMLCNYLIAENFEVVCATDGQKACEAFDIGSYSIVLLDLMIPKITGMNVMKYIRQKSTVPIIIISAKDSDSDKTLGLGLGADDYITKPFSITEVMARIKANIRRNTEYAAVQPEQTKLVWDPLVMNLENHTVTKSGEIIELTAKEFDILRLLLENPHPPHRRSCRPAGSAAGSRQWRCGCRRLSYRHWWSSGRNPRRSALRRPPTRSGRES